MASTQSTRAAKAQSRKSSRAARLERIRLEVIAATGIAISRREWKARLLELQQVPVVQMLRSAGDMPLKTRDRFVGRWQRSVRWMACGNVIAPDWRDVRSGYSGGLLPKRSG